ncbi:MAG: histidine phosphatase family protein [Chloroflexales bacterium]|nr:histidine phosphatase family protein [Chloroflexales bacterium]
MMTTTVYLIRHGETDWNVTGRWQGHADVPLNALGRRQAELLAQRLRDEDVRFDAIYSSDLARAYQTAWELGAAVKAPVQLLPPLREIDLGAWSGLTRDDIRERYPIEFALLEEGQDVPRGGGETLLGLRKRVVEAVDAIVAQHPRETLALVTHGGPVRMLLAHAAQHGDGWRSFAHIGNTSVSILHCNGPNWTIVTQNDMRHLADVPQAPDLMSAPPDDAEQPQEWNP